jgi:hypothetical protein
LAAQGHSFLAAHGQAGFWAGGVQLQSLWLAHKQLKRARKRCSNPWRSQQPHGAAAAQLEQFWLWQAQPAGAAVAGCVWATGG